MKRSTALYLAIGLVTGLFLTACAGVVSGQVDLPTILGPQFQVQQAPAVDGTGGVVPVAPQEIAPGQSANQLEMQMASQVLAASAIKHQAGANYYYPFINGHFCDGG
jgi:hypothetical protein